MPQPSEPHEQQDRGAACIVEVPQTAPDLRALAACIAELRVRRRRLETELAATDERLIEARRQAGPAGGLGARRRDRAAAFAHCIGQLARRRDFLTAELAACEIDIDFEIAPVARQAYAELRKRFDALKQCAGMANIRRGTATGRDRSVRGNAHAGERPALFPPSTEFAWIRGEPAPLHLRNGEGIELLIFPCFVAVLEADDRLALIDIRQMQVSISDHRPDGDASLTASADDRMRPRHSQSGPTVRPMAGGMAGRHGQLLIASRAGLAEAFDIRDASRCRAFATAWAGYVAVLPAGGGAFARSDGPASFQPLEIPDRPQLPPPPHQNPWPVLVAGALAAVTLVAWGTNLLPDADRIGRFVADLRNPAAGAADSLVGFLHRDAAPAVVAGDLGRREPIHPRGGSPPALKPILASELRPADAPSDGELAPAAGSAGEQSAATASESTTLPLQTPAAGTPDSAQEPPLATTPTLPLSRSDVIALQTKLQILGFQPGSADGIAGRRTVRAVKAFQRAHGLSATGIIDRQLLKAVLDAPKRQTSNAVTAAKTVAEAPMPLLGPAANPSDGLLTASERGR